MDGSVTERNESNTYELEFQMCWPADLWPGPSMFLLHNDGTSSLELKFGTEVCITPDYLQVRREFFRGSPKFSPPRARPKGRASSFRPCRGR